MKPFPFRFRIALWSVLISGAVLVTFGTTAGYVMYRERLGALDREMRALAYRHPGWMSSRANYERLSSVIEFVFGEERKEQLILLVKDATGTTRYISPHWPNDLDPQSLDLRLEDDPSMTPSGPAARGSLPDTNDPKLSPRGPPPWAGGPDEGGGPGPGPGRMRAGSGTPVTFSKIPRFYTVRLAQSAWRIAILGHEDDRLVMGLNYAGLQAELDQMRNAFLLALPVALLVVGWGGWWMAGRAVRPLRAITQTAEQMTARGLDQRIPVSEEDPEIARLIRVLNGMMDRLEKSFHQATRFSADASHELKTPLAVMQGELENALQAAAPGSREQQVYANLLEETQRLKAITRSLLFLAQADAGHLRAAFQPLDLSACLRGLSEDIEVLAEAAQLQVNLNLPPDVWVEADWSLLRQAVLNLLNNAIQYNEPNGRLGIDLLPGETEVQLEVWNSGPGIALADQPKLFNRFFRADPSRSRRVDGMGLGLSLAQEIVRAHGGNVALKESRPGRTCFTLTLPRRPA